MSASLERAWTASALHTSWRRRGSPSSCWKLGPGAAGRVAGRLLLVLHVLLNGEVLSMHNSLHARSSDMQALKMAAGQRLD